LVNKKLFGNPNNENTCTDPLKKKYISGLGCRFFFIFSLFRSRIISGIETQYLKGFSDFPKITKTRRNQWLKVTKKRFINKLKKSVLVNIAPVK